MNGLLEQDNTLSYSYFPTTWQAVIWRNWGYVPIERVGEAICATSEEVVQAATMLGF